MGDLVAARFSLLNRSAHSLECFLKERLNVVWLQATRLGTLHVFTNSVNAARVHRIVDQCPLVKQFLEMASIERLV
jgi:hypothetical protein